MKEKNELLFLYFGAVLLIMGCLGTDLAEITYIPGIYEGSGQGYMGEIHVRVQLSSAGIEDIQIISHGEGAFSGAAAMEELLDLILIEGTTDLDAVSGASYSSRGFLEAVEDALGRAKHAF